MLWNRSRRWEHILHRGSSGQVIERVPQRLLLPPQPRSGILQLEQRLLLPRSALERAPDEERERRRELILPKVLHLLLSLPVQSIRQPDHVLHVRLHFAGQRLEVVAPVARRPVLEPIDPGDQVGPRADDARDPEPLLPLADEEEPVVGEALVLDDLADAADVRGPGGGVGVHDAEAEVGLEERVHHHPVPELEDLEGEDRAGEEDEGEGEERELGGVGGGRGAGAAVLRGRGGGRAPEGARPPPAPPVAGEAEAGRGQGGEIGTWVRHGGGGGGRGRDSEGRRGGRAVKREGHC